MTETTTLPEVRLYVRNINHEVNKDLIARGGGTIEEVFLFDCTRAVHCCELTPSYEMRFLYTTSKDRPENEVERDGFYNDLGMVESEADLFLNIHCRAVNLDTCQLLRKVDNEDWQKALDEADGDERVAHDELMESLVEHYKCNWPY